MNFTKQPCSAVPIRVSLRCWPILPNLWVDIAQTKNHRYNRNKIEALGVGID